MITLDAKSRPLEWLASLLLSECTVMVRMLAYGIHGDIVDEYLRMSGSTCLASLYKFRKAVATVFGPEYLREPNAIDTSQLLGISVERGFSGMLGTGSGRTVCLPGKDNIRGM